MVFVRILHRRSSVRFFHTDRPSFFGNLSYWDSFYESSRVINDWFTDSDSSCRAISTFLANNISAEKQEQKLNVGHLGSGQSSLGFTLARQISFIQRVVNIDGSRASLEWIRANHGRVGDEKEVFFEEADLLQEGSAGVERFDVCVDKGTLDALEYAKRETEYLTNVALMLKHDGWFLQISDQPPEARDHLLLFEKWKRAGWKEVDENCFLYFCQK